MQKVRNMLSQHKIDALLVSNPYNILFLSGFKGLSFEEREAWIFITKKNPYFFTDGRYEGQVQSVEHRTKNVICKIISHEKKLSDFLREIIIREKIKKIGFESEDLRVAEHEKFCEKIPAQFIPTEQIILKVREIKSNEEIKTIQKACAITDQCLADIVKTIKIGRTEAEIASRIELWIKQKGYDLAFYPIVAVDKNSAEAHYDTRTEGKTKIKKGSVVLIDFGVLYRNYRSDITRMIFAGKPSNEIADTYNVLLKAQTAGLSALRDTNRAKDIDAVCRRLLTAGKQPNYSHSTGHGVGLEIHENPKLSIASKDRLQKGHVFTVEPGIYIPRKYGMRIEDTVALTEDRKPKILTKFSKKLLVINIH